MKRRERTLFPVNVWPPMVDAVTLVLAAFALIAVIVALGQHALVGRLRDKERELTSELAPWLGAAAAA